MQLEGVGVTQPNRPGLFRIQLKFGKQAYYVVELRRGEERREREEVARAGRSGGAVEGSELRKSVGRVGPIGTALREQENADVPGT